MLEYWITAPVDTGRKLNVHKTSWTSSERLMYVQFTSCVYWGGLYFSDWQFEMDGMEFR